MAKPEDNLARQALIAGEKTCMEDLLNLKCTSEGHHNKIEIRNAIWAENDKDIKAILDGKKKVKDIWEDEKGKRNYLERINLDDARVWFRYRSKMTHLHSETTWTADTATQLWRNT